MSDEWRRVTWQGFLHRGHPDPNPYPVDVVWLLADLWWRVLVTLLASLSLVRVALHAAGSFNGERRTVDPLFASPVELHSVLFAKWLGSLLSARGNWLWKLALWGLSMVCGAGHSRILLLFLVAWTIYAGCFAKLGLWFSLRCVNTQKATLWTLTTIAVLSAGHWLPWLILHTRRYDNMENHLGWIPSSPVAIQMFGLTSPPALGWIALRGEAAFLPEGAEYRGDVRIVRWKDFLESTRTQPLLLHSGRSTRAHTRRHDCARADGTRVAEN